jgi:hypothetical protein
MAGDIVTIGGKQYKRLNVQETLGREAPGKKAWNLVLLDETGQKRTAFMRGLETRDAVILQCRTTFRNWTLIEVQPSTSTRPPSTAKPVPPSAYEFGVLKSIQTQRRR